MQEWLDTQQEKHKLLKPYEDSVISSSLIIFKENLINDIFNKIR